MANSSSNRTRHFLIKVSPDAAPVDQNGSAIEVAGWEGRTFLTGRPRQKITWRDAEIPPEGKQDPTPGDSLYIWINGQGLTAVARVVRPVTRVSGAPENRTRRIGVINVRPFRPIGAINDSNVGSRQGGVLEDIRRSRRATLRFLSPQDARELDNEIQRCSPGNPPSLLPAASVPTSPPALDPNELADERQRVMRLIEQRANQGPFRDAVMARDGRRCVVTGCRATEVLEAAHLIPYASGHPERDNPANGILLRADIHLLFDCYLMAINPETMSLWMSDRVQERVYARLLSKEVRTGAGVDYIRHHYEATTRTGRPS